MKPPPFVYHDPHSVEDALSLLSSNENAKLLAGGQSLMPMLNMRLAFPDHIIDLNRIAELAYVREREDRVEIGAMTRQQDLLLDPIIKQRCPLMHEALGQVGHIQTRNRGTIGGSLCHLDPAAELPVVIAALEGSVQARGPRGEREVQMSEFPAFYMTPSIEPDELVTRVRFEPWPPGHGFAFVEYARRLGDFAVVAAAVLVALADDGSVSRTSIVLGGVDTGPVRCTEAQALLVGSRGEESALEQAAEMCRGIDAMEDVHASKAYRQHLSAVLCLRAMKKALRRAARGAGQEVST